MRHFRTPEETMIDEALTLSMLSEIERVSDEPVDRLRLQKLIFLVSYEWFGRRWKGFNYPFFRYHRGPFTKDLYQTEMELSLAGLIECHKNWSMNLTDEGQRLADALIEQVWNTETNHDFWDDIRRIVGEYGELSTRALLHRVYEKKVIPLGWRDEVPLGEVPIGTDLTRVFDESEALDALEMPDDWVETFGLTKSRARRKHEPELTYERV